MKNINVVFTDTEYESLQKQKKDLNWHDFILSGQKATKANTDEITVTISRKDVNEMLEALDRIEKAIHGDVC